MNWPLNHWIVRKVGEYLGSKEGCEIASTEATKIGVTMTFRDSFGYVYEMNVRTLGRIQTSDDEVAKYDIPARAIKEIVK